MEVTRDYEWGSIGASTPGMAPAHVTCHEPPPSPSSRQSRQRRRTRQPHLAVTPTVLYFLYIHVHGL